VSVLFALLGVALGAAQASMLGRAVRARSALAPPLVRIGLVAVALGAAAWVGHLLPAALGWLGGFVVAVAVIRRRLA
jgi:hypothetical protein